MYIYHGISLGGAVTSQALFYLMGICSHFYSIGGATMYQSHGLDNMILFVSEILVPYGNLLLHTFCLNVLFILFYCSIKFEQITELCTKYMTEFPTAIYVSIRHYCPKV